MNKRVLTLALLFVSAMAAAQTQYPPTSGSVGGGGGGGGGSGTVTSVSGGTTGITVTNPTTTPTLGGILNKANGGTGTATPALVAGSNISLSGTWPANTITVTPSGSPNQVQYNSGGSLAGDPNFQIFASSGVYTGSLGFFANGNGGLTAGGDIYIGNANPLGASADGEISLSANKADNTAYALYLVTGGQTILNSPTGTDLQLRVGGQSIEQLFSIGGGNGGIAINGSGTLVANGALNVSNGNGALEFDQNGISEFFVKNTSAGNSVGSLVAVENGTAEGWLFLGGPSATNLVLPHAANTVELYAHNGAPLRLSTQDNLPMDFWTNAKQRAIITSTGTFAINTASPPDVALFDVVSTSSGSLPAPQMTTTQKNAIASPVDGLMVYDTSLHAYYYWNNNSSAWSTFGSSASPGGATNNVQYNNGTTFAGDNGLNYDPTGLSGSHPALSVGTTSINSATLSVHGTLSGGYEIWADAGTGLSAGIVIQRGLNDGGGTSLQWRDNGSTVVWDFGMQTGANDFTFKNGGTIVETFVQSSSNVQFNQITTGHALCEDASHNLGHCTTQPDAGGACTCTAN